MTDVVHDLCQKCELHKSYTIYSSLNKKRLIRIFPLLLALSIEFSLNDFLWIQRIQWIMTKSKNCMVTRDILYLRIDTFLDIVVKSNLPLLSVGWYLFRVVSGNRYLPRGSNENTLCIASTDNVSVARWVIPLVATLLLDLVMIHWIRWIQGKSFRENSNEFTEFS